MTSNINPNNIDGAYPVAGQDNNSQGFRDNFTNTKTNFGYAKAEITDLQNNAVLKSALSGTTLNNDMNGSILSNFQGQNISGTVVALGTISGDVGINYAAGPYQTVTTGGSVSLAFTNFTAAGTQDTVIVQVTVTDVAYTLTFPSAVGTGASATSLIGIQGLDIGTNTITFAATGTYVYSFTTTDGGTTIYLNDLTQSRNGFAGNVSVVGNLSVTGTITGNIEIDNIESIVGNVTAGNLLTGGLISATSNITGGNILTVGIMSSTGNATHGNVLSGGNISATGNVIGGNVVTVGLLTATGNVTGGNVLTAGLMSSTGNATHGNILTAGLVSATGNVSGGNVRTTGLITATGNITGGNILTGGLLSVTGNVTSGNIGSIGALSRALDVEVVAYANITATNTYSLSTTSSINVLIANNTGYTATLNMPSTPVEGQICNFTVSGNTVTLAVGTGTVLPTFDGSTTVGTGFRYVYRVATTSWYRIG